ncbi:response regulator [Marispirochaeta sp.]|uniref:response regulator n=1 Tax=Marispirochaeta sp. TaxID=2038653 RepID=UPI0029C67041|nr:response regulator [Marispirochaeta sp.]
MHTLLIADDERLEREALKYIIRRGTADIDNIVEAVNGREAIEAAEKNSPDIAFLDIKMPGINGVETARRLKELLPACKIVFLTAFDTFDYAREALRLGAEDFLVKPVEDERVLELLDKLVRQVQIEHKEQQIIDRTRETLQGMIRSRETELSRQLTTGFLDTNKLNDYMTLAGIKSPRLELALLAVDLESYPMRVDREQHAQVLLTRCEQLCRREMEKQGLRCISGRLQSGILMLLINGEGIDSPLSRDSAEYKDFVEGMERTVREQVSLRAKLTIENKIPDFPELERRLSRLVLPEGAGTGPSVFSLKESLLHWIESGDDDVNQVVGQVFRWLDSQAAAAAALSSLDEVLAVVRHDLFCRIPGLELPPNFRTGFHEIPEEGVEAALREILRCLRDAAGRRKVAAGHPAVTVAADVMKQRFREELSVDMVADRTGHSVSHLSRLFRQELGMSILDFLTRLRMDEAKKLLREGEMQISCIAEEVGFQDPNYFSRVFRRDTGLSPREYRLSAKSG